MNKYQNIFSDVKGIINKKKKIHNHRLKSKVALSTLGLDIADLVDIIFYLEEKYQIFIPDDVPLETVEDLVNYTFINSKIC